MPASSRVLDLVEVDMAHDHVVTTVCLFAGLHCFVSVLGRFSP